ncbi:hypothetical protein, partial [Romboutsia sp.]|uniref:hypothetical protein n=1 Tax=Romboutsia sp. TaxID=1965302 RepID=UPI002C301192
MLIIDGLDLENNGFIFVLNGLFNNEKQLFESDLFSDGSFIGNEKIKAKKLSLNGTITNNLVSNMDKLNQILYRKGAKKIEFSMGNKEYMMMANVENTSLSDKRSIVINLISPDPYKYSRYPEVLNINETKGVGVKFPLQFPVKFEGGESFERYITNIGNVTSYPVITI